MGRAGSLEWFYRHGVADIGSRTPVAVGNDFRIASITQTFMASAVTQLCSLTTSYVAVSSFD